jgi:hypothetical protein
VTQRLAVVIKTSVLRSLAPLMHSARTRKEALSVLVIQVRKEVLSLRRGFE